MGVLHIDNQKVLRDSQARRFLETLLAETETPFKLQDNQLQYTSKDKNILEHAEKLQETFLEEYEVALNNSLFGKRFAAAAHHESLENARKLIDENTVLAGREYVKLHPFEIINNRVVHTGDPQSILHDFAELRAEACEQGLHLTKSVFGENYFKTISEEQAWLKKKTATGELSKDGNYWLPKYNLKSTLNKLVNEPFALATDAAFIFYRGRPDRKKLKEECEKYEVKKKPSKLKAIIASLIILAGAGATYYWLTNSDDSDDGDNEYEGKDYHIWKWSDQKFMEGRTTYTDGDQVIEKRNGLELGDRVIYHGEPWLEIGGGDLDGDGECNENITVINIDSHPSNDEFRIDLLEAGSIITLDTDYNESHQMCSVNNWWNRWWQVILPVIKHVNGSREIIDIPIFLYDDAANGYEYVDLCGKAEYKLEDNLTKPADI